MWTSNFEPECQRCNMLATARIKNALIGSPLRKQMAEADRHVAPYIPVYVRFCVSIKILANSIFIKAHGEYQINTQ